MDVPSTDQELIDSITSLVMNDEPLSQATDLYVRAAQGRSLEEEVDDSEAYWDAYHARLVDLVLRSIVTWTHMETQEELVF